MAAADDQWDTLRAESARLLALRADAERRRDLLERLDSAAPELASRVASRQPVIEAERFPQAWIWRQLDVWFDALDEGPEPSELQALLERLARDRLRVTEDLVATRAWTALAASIDDRRRTALGRFTTANAKLGKGTGRYTPVWEAEVREAMNDAKDAVPVWIMPVHKVLSSFRPAAEPPFDVMIIDEASQIGLLDTPILALAKRAIVVGDDQQTSPENVGTERQPILDLIDDHLGENPRSPDPFRAGQQSLRHCPPTISPDRAAPRTLPLPAAHHRVLQPRVVQRHDRRPTRPATASPLAAPGLCVRP